VRFHGEGCENPLEWSRDFAAMLVDATRAMEHGIFHSTSNSAAASNETNKMNWF
jgi:hypothetical protein